MESSDPLTVSDVCSQPVSTVALFEVVCPVVVFQFISRSDLLSPATTTRVSSYVDNLNSWLGQILQRDVPNVPLEVIDVESVGYCLRIAPLEFRDDISNDAVAEFVQCLEQQLEILNATVKHKITFVDLVGRSDSLQLVEIPQWAGLGGVCFVPQIFQGQAIDQLPDQGKEEVNRINRQLVARLKSTDAAFSLGEGEAGLACVRFGMVTEETEVCELVSLVEGVGLSIEENSKQLESMAEMVRKGIESVTSDLQREAEEKLWEEGILRHVPLVGTFVNWWSPPAADGLRGRSLNLRGGGVVESTENTYKYHMQLEQQQQQQNAVAAAAAVAGGGGVGQQQPSIVPPLQRSLSGGSSSSSLVAAPSSPPPYASDTKVIANSTRDGSATSVRLGSTSTPSVGASV